MKKSTRRNIRRQTTTTFGITLLVALVVSSVTGLFRDPMTEAARSRENNALVSGRPAPDEATRAGITEAFGKLPMSFEANEGQTDGRVKFLSRGGGYTLFLTSTEAVLSLSRPEEPRNKSLATDRRDRKKKGERVRRDVLRMRLLGARTTPQVEGADELSVRSNYFIGNDPKKWRTDVRQYAKVKYTGVYPGIDLIYYGNQQELEYDFIVAPGASPSKIRLAFKGAEEVSIDDEGELILRTGGGEVRQRKPFIYQELAGERREIEGRYAKTGKHEVGFEVGEYDATKPLVIDPVLLYSTYLGDNQHDFGRGIAVDNAGNAYVTGYTESTNFPTRNHYQTDQPLTDAFVTKLDTNLSGDASLVYSTYLGGNSTDIAFGIAADEFGNAYVTGRTDSTNFPTRNQYQTDQVSVDAFVTKLNTNLSGDASLVYSTYLGGSSGDIGNGIAADEAGNAYVTGLTQSSNFPTRNHYQTDQTSNDGFVTRLNTNLSGDASLIYSTYLGGNNIDEGAGIAADEIGNAYVTGFTQSSNFPTTPTAYQSTNQGQQDAFVTKLNTNLSGEASLAYSTYLGGGVNDEGRGIAADEAGNAYATGYTNSANFPTRNQYQTGTVAGNTNAFVTRLNTNLSGDASLVYSTYLAGNLPDIGRGIAADEAGNVYVTGRTDSTNFPTRDEYQTDQPGQDAFVTKLNTNLSGDASLLYSTYLGGNNLDEGFGIDIDSAGNAYVTGETVSPDFPVLNQYQTYPAQPLGVRDAFVVKLAEPTPTLSVNDVSVTEGDSGTVNAAFTVSLSPASGQIVTVNYATANGTATAGSDYQGIGTTTLTFNPGVTSQPVNLLVNGDTLDEDNETFFVNLSGAANATIADNQGVGTINDDDPLPNLAISDVTQVEGNSGTTNFGFTVSLSPASGRTVSVNYTTANGTATAGGDYQAAANALTFNPGETNKPVTVVVIGDTLNEADETFFVNLTNPTNATITDNQGVGTITNDDPVPTGNLTISGRILDDSGLSISGQLVILGGAESGSTVTDGNGNYSFANLSAGNYTVTTSSGNYSFSPANYSFSNLSVDRIANFVGTQTVVSITGRVTDGNDVGLGSVTLGLSMDGIPVATTSTDAVGNFGFGNLTAGANYVVMPVGSFSPSLLFFNNLSVNATANFTVVPSIPPTSAAISGRAADANNNPLVNVTVTLSGPITRVTSTDGAGNYSFANLALGGNYAVTIQNTYFVFGPSRADFSNLSGSQTFNFQAAPVVVPSPLPPPSDDFNSSTRDPNKWNLGILTQPPTAFDPLVNVAQINGQLVITPLAQVSGLHYNGYVSANSFDLRGGSVSVELVQAASGGADTIFAIGSDVDNFYRFMVHIAGPVPTPGGRDGIERPSDTAVAQLLFQVNVGGVLTALSIPYDPVAHRFMRFRHEALANAIVFETSPDNIAFTERHRVVLSRSVSALTAELSAGTSSPTNPGTAVFDNFGLVTSTFQFSAASYTVEEGGGSILITVTRSGSMTATGTVDYATADGTALQTTKYINAAGRLTFAPGEASKAFQVLIIDNALAEGNQNLDLLLQEPANSGLNTPGRAVLTIIDNDTTAPTSNPLEDPTFFVTQHYYDFLNREADAPGLAFWVDQITGCGGDTQCIEIRRINVSAAYFLSIEFQETGFLVHRFYNLALNRPNGLPRYLEFFRDTQAIGNGVIVGADGWEALLEANRVSYANEFATRAEFTALYPLTLSAAEYVDALYAHAAITPSAAERQAAIDEFSTPAGARGRVLRRVAENQALSAREFNRAFVLAQYFGYLRRNPDDAPDNNLDGYNFWLNKLNEFNGNFVNAEMVKAFITSGEYRQRFGP